MTTRYADETQESTIWLELIEHVRDTLRTMQGAGKLPGIANSEHIEIRKLPIVRDADTDDHTTGMFVCPAPEQSFPALSMNGAPGFKLGVLVTGWAVTDQDMFAGIGRVLHWRRQMFLKANGLNVSHYQLASTKMAGEMEPGPVFDTGAWQHGIDQTTVMIRGWTRSATV